MKHEIKKYITIVLTLLSIQFTVHAQDSDEIFTIYLVRHSEKDLSANNPKDPPLTHCGHQRAESLNSFLKEVHLDAIYSTDYLRTLNTAQPSAITKELEVKIYDPKELKSFAKLLIDLKEDALVVGHSNTTGVLAGLLIDKEIGEFDEKIYNRIYQIVMYKNKGRLHILHTAFVCKD